MKVILLLALVGCAVNVQVTAAVNTFHGTYDADDSYATANAAPPSINAAAAAIANIPLSDYASTFKRLFKKHRGVKHNITLSDYASVLKLKNKKNKGGRRRVK